MIEQEDFYSSLIADFNERVNSIDTSSLSSYARNGSNSKVREYAKGSIATVQHLASKKAEEFAKGATAVKFFVRLYVRFMLRCKEQVTASSKIDAVKPVLTACREVLPKLKEIESEIKDSIEQLINQRNALLDSEKLPESTETASLNGENISLEEIKLKFEDNAYIRRIINDLQKSKNNNKEKLEFFEYQIWTLRLLKKEVIRKKTHVYDIMDRYYGLFNQYRSDFEVAKGQSYLEQQNIIDFVKELDKEETAFVFETVRIAPKGMVGEKVNIIYNFLKNKREALKGFYNNDSY